MMRYLQKSMAVSSSGSFLQRYSLKNKLLFSFLLMVFSLLFSVGISQRTLRELQHTIMGLSTSAAASEWLTQAAVARINSIQNLWNLVVWYNPNQSTSQIENTLAYLDVVTNQLQMNLKKFALEIQLDSREKAVYEKLMGQWNTLQSALKTFIEKVKKRSFVSQSAIAQEVNALFEHSLVLSDSLTDLSALEQQKGTQSMHYASKLSKENQFLKLSILIIAWILSTISIWFSISISNTIFRLNSSLLGGVEEINTASQQLKNSSNSLAASVSEQAATLQEISSTLEEVSLMVQKNAGNASKSRELSKISAETAGQGQLAIVKTMDAIEEINKSNQDINITILNNNREISNIVKVILEIREKTKVIDDIAFQTKLLSFNASVEAARAGEGGKGFAVVAEEVGSLAELSGNAAKEISQMLSNSTQTVKNIADTTRVKVEALVRTTQNTVNSGVQVAKSCQEILNQVVTQAQEVDNIVKEVDVSSAEQAKGIVEISKAIAAIETVNQQNSNAAQETASTSEQLSTQVQAQKMEVHTLKTLVEGNAGVDESIQDFRDLEEKKSA